MPLHIVVAMGHRYYSASQCLGTLLLQRDTGITRLLSALAHCCCNGTQVLLGFSMLWHIVVAKGHRYYSASQSLGTLLLQWDTGITRLLNALAHCCCKGTQVLLGFSMPWHIVVAMGHRYYSASQCLGTLLLQWDTDITRLLSALAHCCCNGTQVLLGF